MKNDILITALSLLVLSSCSNKGIYEQIQTNNRVECGKLSPSQYEECVEGNSKHYDEYERERQEVLNN